MLNKNQEIMLGMIEELKAKVLEQKYSQGVVLCLDLALRFKGSK
jgi:hypothetical protein